MRWYRFFPLAFVVAGLLLSLRPAFAQSQDSPEEAKIAAQQKEEHEKDFEDGEKGESGEYIRKRQHWFHDQRAYPLKHIPAGIRQRAIKVRDLKTAAAAAARRSALSATGSATGAQITPLGSGSPAWTLIGPQPVGNYYGVSAGRVTALAVNPSNPSIVYAGGAEGGVWKTTNGGSSWTSLTDKQPSLAVGSLALDPSNPNTIYVGTGEENFSGDSYYGAGVLKSTDGGTTWTQYCGPFCGPESVSGYADPGAYIGSIAVDPNNNQIVLAAVELYGAHGVYRSINGGSTWTLVSTDGGIANIVLFDPVNVGIAYAASETAGILKSTNHGQTWTVVNGTGGTALPTLNGGRIALAIAPSSPLTLYAGIANSATSELIGMYKTTDGGNTWNQLTAATNYCSTQCWYDNVIGVSPVNANIVFAGGSYAYSAGSSAALRSLDGGATWSDQGPVHPDAHAMAFSADGTILYTGNDGGVWSTANPSATPVAWTSLNPTLALTEFYPGLSIDPNNINRSYGGTQDNGTNKYSGSLDWPTVDCGDGGSTAIDFNTPTTAYTTCVGLSVDKTTNDGSSFTSMISGINSSDNLPFIPTLSMDPENPKTLYFGTYRVYQTTNGASSWTAISPDLTKGDGYDTVVVMTVAPKDSNTVYAASYEGKLSVTRNASTGASATWSTLSGTSSLPNRSITSVAVDPTTAATAYVGYSGFTGYGDNLGHIFMTTNAGTTWTDISSDLPNTPVDAILVDPDSPQTIFIGTDIGAFYTSNRGASWSTLGTGLPNVVVTGLALHENSRTLRASTHGRSVWDLNISTLLAVPSIYSISPASVSEGNPQFTLTVNGVQFATNSVVQFNGTALATTYVSATQLTAVVPAADVNLPGTANITVSNPTAGNISNASQLTITYVASATTTTLTVSPTSGTLGTLFTMKASVTDRSGAEMKGSVSFYNGSALLATVQVISQTDSQGSAGTAVYKTKGLLAGSNSITAKWNPTTLDSASTSGAQTVTVTGQYLTQSVLASTGSQGSYVLNDSVISIGPGVPTGMVTFTDSSTMTTLGTSSLTPANNGFDYTAQNPITIGPTPSQTVLADLNGDGILDMVTASYNGSTNWLSVALGNGTTFNAQTPVTTGANSNNGGNSLAIADVNGDGIPDIVANGYSGLGLAVFLGNGDGTFGAENDFPVDSSYATALAVGDFNRDGHIDVVTVDYFGNTISVLLGNGDGTFQKETPYATGTNPEAVAVGDVNGDGIPDLAVMNPAGNVSLFLGNGDGTFKAQQVLPVDSHADYAGPSGIAIGDVNGDGKPDIVVPVYGAVAVSVLAGNGDGTFKPFTNVAGLTGLTPNGVVIADINRDGILDMVVSSNYGSAVGTLLGTGGGNFVAKTDPEGSGGNSVAVGDLNGQGLLDAVIPNQNDGTVSVMLAAGYYGASISGVTLPGLTNDNVVATYSGDSRFLGSTSNTLSLASNASAAATPTFSPAAGTYSTAQTVKILDGTSGAAIYFTTDGSTPTTSSAKYTGTAISVTASETLKAIAVATGYAQSPVATAVYAITYGITVTPGSYVFSNTVVGSSTTSTAITLKNSSSTTLSGIAFSIVGTNATSFSLPSGSMQCGSTLAAGASCTFAVAFTPTTTGTLTATLSIADSATGSPQTVALSGTAVPNTPTVAFDGIGSTSLFLGLGQAASAATTASPAGLGATCLWSTKTLGIVVATDNSASGAGKTDTGSAWVAWTPVSGSCSTTNATTVIYAYLAADSVVANRCLFNGCTIKYGGSGSASAGLINSTGEVPLAAGIATALNGTGTGMPVTAAGTDIRPEDAEFATARALTPCGTPVASGSQYLGLGYTNGTTVKSYYSAAAFNVINFALPASYTVTPIGASPLVVLVNGQSGGNGFSDPAITNVTSGALALFLDGTFSQTQDALTSASTSTTEPITVLLREPLSGAYNLMEYGVVNTQSLKSSQDVGLTQSASEMNCTGTAVKSNPMSIPAGAGFRRRAIGTAEELYEVGFRVNAIGYAFWSAANFKAFTPTASPYVKYLTVDGVDPLQTAYTGGAVPTTSAQLSGVTLANVANGSYPIWSVLRLVNLGASPSTGVSNLAAAAQNFASGSAQPDFVPYNNLFAVHSHFIPPAGTGYPAAALNGTARACGPKEAGGDVGGVVLTKAGDYDYCYDFGVTSGRTGLRR